VHCDYPMTWGPNIFGDTIYLILKVQGFAVLSSYLVLCIEVVLLLVHRPLELQYKYGNLSKGECKPGYTEAKMTLIYPK